MNQNFKPTKGLRKKSKQTMTKAKPTPKTNQNKARQCKIKSKKSPIKKMLVKLGLFFVQPGICNGANEKDMDGTERPSKNESFKLF